VQDSIHGQGGSVIVERSVWVCLLTGITRERERERERERICLMSAFQNFIKMGKKRGDQNEFLKERHFSRKRNNIPAAMSNPHVRACDDLFSFFIMM
jgi:hypothetical protein